MVVKSGSLDGVMVNTLALNARGVGLIPALSAIFPIFITPMTLAVMSMILYKIPAIWLSNLSYVYICEVIHWSMYVIISIKRLTIPGRTSVVIYTDF